MSTSTLEKDRNVEISQVSAHGAAGSGVDAAWTFLDRHRDVAGATEDDGKAVNIDALRRKIDWHIVPLMFLCYTMQFLDKVTLNVCTT